MSAYLDWKDGWLAVRVVYPAISEPVIVTSWYPVSEMPEHHARSYPLGEEMQDIEGGRYLIGRTQYNLIEGGRTKAIATKQIDVPKPPDDGKVVKYRGQRVPHRMAPFQRISYSWTTRYGWERRKEFLTEDEAAAAGLMDW